MNYILAIITIILLIIASYIIGNTIGCNPDILFVELVASYLFIRKFVED